MKMQESPEDYLEAILVLSRELGNVRSIDVANYLEYSKPSVSVAMKRLRENGFVTLDEHGNLILTGSGLSIALKIYERHLVISQFLISIGVDEEIAKKDACRMEHVVSEETVQQICNFVDYGDTFERILKHSDLRSWYQTGKYMFLMGIYQIEKTCPRRFAREFDCFSENIWLHITEDKSSFELIKKEDTSAQNLWYKDPEQGWIEAEEKMGNPWISSGAFTFSTRCQDPIIEGTALIAFTRKGEKPVDWNSRELDVHIWKSEG